MYVLASNQIVEKFPYSIGDLRKDNPQTSFPRNPTPETLAEWGVYPVVSTGTEYDPATQVAVQEGCEYVNGRWQTAWTVRDKTPEELATDAANLSAQINDERDRRMTTTFSFGGKAFDCDDASLARITGAATLAGFAIGAGAVAGFMTWHGGADDFAWIAADNSLVPMDAPTCFAFGQAAAANQSAHIFAAKSLKESSPIPADYTDGQYWP